MPVLTKSALAQLLDNIAEDLGNTTAHPNLANLTNQGLSDKGQAVGPVFRARDLEVPYAVVTWGGMAVRSGGGGRRGPVQVFVHLVHSVLSDESGADVGIGTAAADGIATLLEAVEEALASETRGNAPYSGSTYGAAPYTAQTAVRTVRPIQWSAPQEVEEVRPGDEGEELVARVLVMQTLELQYHLEKGP